MPKIKIDKELYERARQAAETAGYASLEEFVTAVLERELRPTAEENNDEEVIKRLKGLGYLS